MARTIEHEPIAASDIEQTALAKIQKALRSSSETITSKKAKLVSPDGEEIEIPTSVFNFLKQLVYYLQHGQAVSIVPINREMTTQEAADLLNVSRPYLTSLLKKGEIPFKMVGTHRRINFDDLIEYKRRRDTEREAALSRITKLSQEFGVYD